MATPKRITDLTDYTSVLPYASEIFGIYQPLLGWKSKRIEKRFKKGLDNDKTALLKALKEQFTGNVKVKYGEGCQIEIGDLKPGNLIAGNNQKAFDSIVMIKIAEKLPPFESYTNDIWEPLLSDQNLHIIFKDFVIPQFTKFYEETCKKSENFNTGSLAASRSRPTANTKAQFNAAFEKQLVYESALAGSFQYLLKSKNFDALKNTFYTSNNSEANAITLIKALSSTSTEDAYLNLENLDPKDKTHIQSVGLSPISVVHLFRQYFFELDTFLGTPVGHIWLSPGASAELIEVSTRKTIIEKTLETTLETIAKSEKSTTQEDEISDAVKEDNKQDIKFGASITASYASVTATSNFDFNNSQQKAREETHKRMRQQTEKLSTEIRKNVKSTFKTVTEVTDTSSKRYLLANNTPDLINYEMRRKMRQVGVQVQDIGTYLCWQTYVDDPGKDLGIAKLVHIAKSADLDNIPYPDEIPNPSTETSTHPFTIPFVTSDGADKDEPFKNGHEVDKDFLETEGDHVQSQFEVTGILPPKSDLVFDSMQVDTHGESIQISLLDQPWETKDANDEPVNKPPYNFKINLDFVNFGGKDKIDIAFNIKWKPTQDVLAKIKDQNAKNLDKYNAKAALEFQKTYVENARERIKIASKIEPRKSEELREEERIVVYRRLIQDMLSNGIDMPDDRTRHIVAELINSIFDVDKMLYFVAPEWWRPRLHRSHQQLEETKTAPSKFEIFAANAIAAIVNSGVMTTFHQKSPTGYSVSKLESSVVGWGGINENNRDNYYITEESEPAKLGSSLGWLLQLDGDNMRNAFLNAPWVKAVIPIRPGREEAAINWLKGVEGFNGITDTDLYHASNPNEKDINGNPLDGQKLIDVLVDLAKKIKRKHEEGIKNGQFPKQEDVANPELVDEDNIVTATPIDRVYEHGFYALKDGFRANVNGNYEIFDQWIEILPTDQIVPVAVKYDPKTGRQV
jgi:hypothetical protein